MSQHCGTCRHWDKDHFYVRHAKHDGFGICLLSEGGMHPLMRGMCSSEGIFGELETRETFGCVLHEAKAQV